MTNLSPLNRRLLNDYELMEHLQASSKYISFEAAGDPPNKYVVTYTCTGISRILSTGKVQRSTFHQIEIELTSRYPWETPHFSWLTPIFHPNIIPNNSPCIGDLWTPFKGLNDLVIEIGEMIQYKRLNADNPYNGQAAQWAKENKHIFPIGKEQLLEPVGVNHNNSHIQTVIIHDVENVNLNIAKILSNVEQQISQITSVDQSKAEEFKQLITQLGEELQKLPPEHAEDAETVAEYAKELADEVGKEKPKKTKISITKEGLVKAAGNIANVMPTVLQISKQIADHLLANPK